MSALAAVLFAVGLAGLLPARAAALLGSAWNMYTVGFSADAAGWHALGILAGGTMVSGLWVLSSVCRKTS